MLVARSKATSARGAREGGRANRGIGVGRVALRFHIQAHLLGVLLPTYVAIPAAPFQIPAFRRKGG
eukprot:7377966-Pyramimonas_sp.AAC.1